MEVWDLYQEERIKTEQTMIRGEAQPEGVFRQVVHVCIFNEKGEMLIQQRQPFKKGWSNMWDVTVGGSAVSGDTSRSAAEREVLEEIGHQISLENVRPALTINFPGGFDDYYLVQEEIDINTLKLQEEEVQAVKWASLNEILDKIEEGMFIPYHKSFIELMFFMRNHRGTHTRHER
ncbi:MAG: NUDIX domain-containing protein [Lachnospiraceae bacterium]|nr:NUDIX domain-containing protein [Lachnospiraceae bacterium]